MTIVARLLLTAWLLLLVLALSVAANRALAHSWYDPACCSDQDCRPYVGEVAETAQGYELADGRAVPHRDPRIRPSADGKFHVCARADGSIICLYAPGRGV